MKLVNGLKIAAIAIASLYFFLILLIGARSGNFNAIDIFSDLIFLGFLGIILWLSWNNPRYGGLFLIVCAIGYWIYPLTIGVVRPPDTYAIILTVPLLLAGLLFLLAAWKTPKTTT